MRMGKDRVRNLPLNTVVDGDTLSELPKVYGDLLRSSGVPRVDVRRCVDAVTSLVLQGDLESAEKLKIILDNLAVDSSAYGIHNPRSRRASWLPLNWLRG